MIEGYLVRYLRNGVPDKFFSFDKTRAEEHAVKYGGVISALTEASCQQDNNRRFPPSSMIDKEESSVQDKTAMCEPIPCKPRVQKP